jgi:hypothetical protein
MAPSKRTIRASEIGTFIYCQRAWWYQRKKVKPINTIELAAGQNFHQLHISQSRVAKFLKVLAWLLVVVSAILLSVLISKK